MHAKNSLKLKKIVWDFMCDTQNAIKYANIKIKFFRSGVGVEKFLLVMLDDPLSALGFVVIRYQMRARESGRKGVAE